MKGAVDSCRASCQEDPGLPERFLRELSAIGSTFPLPSLVEQVTESKPNVAFVEPAKPVAPAQPDHVSKDLQEAEAPSAKHNEAALPTARWIDRVRRAVSSLSGSEPETSQEPESETEAAELPTIDLPQDQIMSAREPDQRKSTVPEPKVSPPPAERDDRDWQGARVIESPAAAEMPVNASPKVPLTDLFVAGAAAPALPQAMPTSPPPEPRIPEPVLASPPAATPVPLSAFAFVREAEVPSHATSAGLEPAGGRDSKNRETARHPHRSARESPR